MEIKLKYNVKEFNFTYDFKQKKQPEWLRKR